jgi:hypothetical protein
MQNTLAIARTVPKPLPLLLVLRKPRPLYLVSGRRIDRAGATDRLRPWSTQTVRSCRVLAPLLWQRKSPNSCQGLPETNTESLHCQRMSTAQALFDERPGTTDHARPASPLPWSATQALKRGTASGGRAAGSPRAGPQLAHRGPTLRAGQGSYYDRRSFNPYEELLDKVPLFPAPGDRDVRKGTAQPICNLFTRY